MVVENKNQIRSSVGDINTLNPRQLRKQRQIDE